MKKESNYQGPLIGLNVIDFGHYYAGPAAAMLLADQGAKVIRIVKPGQRELPDHQYRLLNRNKKILTLDLKTAEGKKQALSLIECADILIENFRPGVMKRLGLEYVSIKKTNPGLIYLSLPGFASTDKARAHIQAWEGIMCAAAGVYTETSLVRNRLNFPPVYTWVPQCSMYGAMQGTIAVSAALVAREKYGIGTVIEAPMADGASTGYGGGLLPKGQLPSALKPLVYSPEDSATLLAEKLDKAKQATAFGPTMNAYVCSDKREIALFTFDSDVFNERLLKALGIYQQLLREGFVNAGPWESGLDNNLCDSGVITFDGLSDERKQRFTQLVADALQSRTAEEWESILAEIGVPVSVTRTREEWLALEPMLTSGVLTQMDNGKSVITVPGRFVDVSDHQNALIVDNFQEPEGITVAQANQLFKPRPARKITTDGHSSLKQSDLLKGLTILDMANVAAGPIGGMILAQYGAQVIKGDPPTYLHPGLVASTQYLSQGKRSLLTDMKTAQGQEVFKRLVSEVDVVIHNILDDVAQRLGATYEQLQKINPKIVSCQISAYGGTYRGGWEMRQGFDPLLQGASGLMAQYGTLEQPQWHGQVSCGDTMGGFALVTAALLGVYQQRKTGWGSEARTSLARLISYVQLPFMIAENGRSDWGEARGQLAVGEHRWQRMYACRDQWIYVGTNEARAGMLSKVVTGCEDADEKTLECAFVEHDCAYWRTKLGDADIACHPVQTMQDIYNSAEVRKVNNKAADEQATGSAEFLCREKSPWGEAFQLPTLAWNHVRVGEKQSWRRLPIAPRLGENTREILVELGYTENEIKDLVRIKAVHEYLPALGSQEAYVFTPEEN